MPTQEYINKRIQEDAELVEKHGTGLVDIAKDVQMGTTKDALYKLIMFEEGIKSRTRTQTIEELAKFFDRYPKDCLGSYEIADIIRQID